MGNIKRKNLLKTKLKSKTKNVGWGNDYNNLGDLPSQIESSLMIQIRISNSDDNFDTNPIPSQRSSR